MGQLSVAALRTTAWPETQITTPAASERARNQALVSAVNVINRAGAVGPDREVTYSTDSATKTLIIQVVDKQSKQVLVQWPSDYALQMAQEFQKEHPDK